MRRRTSPLANVPLLARAREGHHRCHARRPTRHCTERHGRWSGRRLGGGARGTEPGRHRAAARRAEVRQDPDRGVEFRDRTLEALALRPIQREPGHAGGAVRRDRGRHPGRRHGRAGRAVGRGQQTRTAPRGAPGAAQRPAAHRAPPRTPRDGVRVRPAAAAHRRGRQRAAGLRARAVLRAPPHPRQVRLPLLPDHRGSGATRTDHRQGYPGAGAARAGGGGQARRPPAAVPAERDLRAIGRAHRAFEHGRGHVWATS